MGSALRSDPLNSTVHLGYNDVSIPQSWIAISKLSLYLEMFAGGTGIADSMGPIRNIEDIVISRIVITRVDCTHLKPLKLHQLL